MSEKLITVQKGKEAIDVHPSALQQHHELGWDVVTEEGKAQASIRESEELPTAESLTNKTKPELVAIAAEQGIDIIPDEMTKQQIIDKILGK